jgi:hypothetical protein
MHPGVFEVKLIDAHLRHVARTVAIVQGERTRQARSLRQRWRAGVQSLAVVGLALFAPLMAYGAEASLSREQQLKAAFLYNFTKFIEWPAPSFASTHDPIVIGVLGHSPSAAALGLALDQTVANRSVNGRGIIVKHVDTAAEAAATHLLFVPSPDEAQFEQIRAALEGSPVLTVGESSAFARLGGAINFVVEGDKVRFEISTVPAERAGLHISAQLQKLARLVRKEAALHFPATGMSQGNITASQTTP